MRQPDTSYLLIGTNLLDTNDILKSIHTTNNVKNEHDDIDNNFTHKRELTRFLSKKTILARYFIFQNNPSGTGCVFHGMLDPEWL